ncbi:MAG: hypothetical protein ABIO46_13385, partial [Chitinophagales bacterium]
ERWLSMQPRYTSSKNLNVHSYQRGARQIFVFVVGETPTTDSTFPMTVHGWRPAIHCSRKLNDWSYTPARPCRKIGFVLGYPRISQQEDVLFYFQ